MYISYVKLALVNQCGIFFSIPTIIPMIMLSHTTKKQFKQEIHTCAEDQFK